MATTQTVPPKEVTYMTGIGRYPSCIFQTKRLEEGNLTFIFGERERAPASGIESSYNRFYELKLRLYQPLEDKALIVFSRLIPNRSLDVFDRIENIFPHTTTPEEGRDLWDTLNNEGGPTDPMKEVFGKAMKIIMREFGIKLRDPSTTLIEGQAGIPALLDLIYLDKKLGEAIPVLATGPIKLRA